MSRRPNELILSSVFHTRGTVPEWAINDARHDVVGPTRVWGRSSAGEQRGPSDVFDNSVVANQWRPQASAASHRIYQTYLADVDVTSSWRHYAHQRLGYWDEILQSYTMVASAATAVGTSTLYQFIIIIIIIIFFFFFFFFFLQLFYSLSFVLSLFLIQLSAATSNKDILMFILCSFLLFLLLRAVIIRAGNGSRGVTDDPVTHLNCGP